MSIVHGPWKQRDGLAQSRTQVSGFDHLMASEHVHMLVDQLRESARDSQSRALARDDGGLELCLDAALASDAAEALETLLRLIEDCRPRRMTGDPI